MIDSIRADESMQVLVFVCVPLLLILVAIVVLLTRSPRYTANAIFSSFPVTAVLFCFFLLIHRSMGPFAAPLVMIGCLIGAASFIVLPLWVVLHIIFNRGRSYAEVLWFQSLLAGAWLAIGVSLSLANSVEYRGAMLIGGLAGGAVALTPYWVHRLRSSSDRKPAG